MERDCCLTLGYAFDERFVYELELKNVISKYDFIFPNYRFSNRGIEFDNFTTEQQGWIRFPKQHCFACLKRRKRDKKIYFHPRKRLNLLQGF